MRYTVSPKNPARNLHRGGRGCNRARRPFGAVSDRSAASGRACKRPRTGTRHHRSAGARVGRHAPPFPSPCLGTPDPCRCRSARQPCPPESAGGDASPYRVHVLSGRVGKLLRRHQQRQLVEAPDHDPSLLRQSRALARAPLCPPSVRATLPRLESHCDTNSPNDCKTGCLVILNVVI